MEIRPGRALPPDDLWHGTRPKRDTNCSGPVIADGSHTLTIGAEAVTGSIPGIDVSIFDTGSFLKHSDRVIGKFGLGLERVKLGYQRPQRRRHNLRHECITSSEDVFERVDVAEALCGDNPDLGKMSAKAVKELDALPDQYLANLMTHRYCLVVDRL